MRETWVQSPGEGNSYPLQYSGLETSMDCIVHGVARVRHDWATFTFMLISGVSFLSSPQIYIIPQSDCDFKESSIWSDLTIEIGEGNGTPLQHSCLENPMDGGAWWAAVHGVAKSQTQLSDFTFIFHFHALEKEMATHSSVLTWRIPGTGEPGGLPSMGSDRVGHDWSNLAAAGAATVQISDACCVFSSLSIYLLPGKTNPPSQCPKCSELLCSTGFHFCIRNSAVRIVTAV